MKLPARSVFLIMGLSLASCFSDSMDPEKLTGPGEFEQFSFEFTVFGGFAGVHEVLHISLNDSVTYTNSNYRVRTVLESGDKQQIFNNLTSEGFFMLDTCYYPGKPIMDDIIYTLQYNSASYSHRVEASGYCSGSHKNCAWPADLHALIDAMREQVARLKDQITSGCVTVYSNFTVVEWPFGAFFSLADSLGGHIEVHDSLFWRIRTDQQQNPSIQYYEDGWIYQLIASIHYATAYEDLDADTTLHVHNRSRPVYWNFQPSLSEVFTAGVMLTGSEYLWLRDTFSTNHYPWYFMDDSLANGALGYQLNLVHGNDCRMR